MFKWIKKRLDYANSKGVAIPILRDSTGRPSVSFTLLVISSVFVMMGLLSLTVPELQINFFEALAWHVTSAVLYYNRGAKISKEGIELTSSKDEDEQEGSDSGREKGDDKGTV